MGTQKAGTAWDPHKLSDAFQSRVRLAVVADLVTGSKTFKELERSHGGK